MIYELRKKNYTDKIRKLKAK